MTNLLYNKSSYIKEFTATVLSCEQTADDTYAVVLDRTAFFPEQGGQGCEQQGKGDEAKHWAHGAPP